MVGWCDDPGYSRAGAYCACSRCGWGLFGQFYSPPSFLFSFSLSLGDGPIETEIRSQRAVKPKTTNQPEIKLLLKPFIKVIHIFKSFQTASPSMLQIHIRTAKHCL